MLEMPDNKVAIIPLFDPDQSPGGIWIPEQAKERCDQGIVKYVGPKVEYTSVGAHVLFPGYSGKTLRLEGEGILIILSEPDLLCTISGDDDSNLDIPGLFFKGSDGQQFTATYEMAMDFIARALQESPKHAGLIKTQEVVRGSLRGKRLNQDKEKIKEYFNV